MIKPGARFTHASFLEPGWVPSKGQKFADGPKAEMVITATTSTLIYYRYANVQPDATNEGAWVMDRPIFVDRYLTSVREHQNGD